MNTVEGDPQPSEEDGRDTLKMNVVKRKNVLFDLIEFIMKLSLLITK